MTYSQDGNQRTASTYNRTYYLYDALGRMTEQGVCTDKNTSSKQAHVVNYYDDYSFIGTNFSTEYYNPATAAPYGQGQLTGQEITVLETNEKVYIGNYYDVRGRVVKTVESNVKGGYDITTTSYSFTDKPVTVTHTHSTSAGTTLTEVITYTYDHADRLSTVTHKLNSNAAVTLAGYTYDSLGRMGSKTVGPHASTYSYNLRGWVTGISGDKFSQNVYYNQYSNSSRFYNGNIAAMSWKAGDEETVRGYRYSYDGLNRLQIGAYAEGETLSSNSGRYTEQAMTYDKNGNITRLLRFGQTDASTYSQIDNLTYTLTGNQLKAVSDAATSTAYNGGADLPTVLRKLRSTNTMPTAI